jgi:hypothetical protein
VVAAGAFIAASLIDMVAVPTRSLSLWLEFSFALSLAALVVAQTTRSGDLGARIGLVLLTAPLFIHFFGVVRALFLDGEEVVFSGLPERVQSLGQWSLVLAALVSPYCFAPRPFLRSAARVGPLVVGAFVGLIGALVLRQNYAVGMEIAMRGLGIDIGPMAPTSMIALYLMALGALAWTLTATLTAPAPARRRIGIGVGLVFVGGYAFAWPLQYLASLVGLMAIGDASRRVREQEREDPDEAPHYRVPPISSEVWAAYVSALTEVLRGMQTPEDRPAFAVTVDSEGGIVRTHVAATLHGAPIRLSVERQDGSIASITVLVGELAEPPGAPSWTLHARPQTKIGAQHPEPPRTPAPVCRTGDETFDARFQIRDAASCTASLLDDDMRGRAMTLIDGWLAIWSKQGLEYRVHPARGAPLDNPIPITELAFRNSVGPGAAERLTTLLSFLAALATRFRLPGQEQG